MNRIPQILITFTAIFALVGCAMAPAPVSKAAVVSPSTDANLNGQWAGVLDTNRPSSDKGKLRLRLTLENSDIKVVYQNSEGAWTEAMPGLFRISRQGSNAVIQATNPGIIDGKGWYETWVFVVTAQSEIKLLVEYVRLVNNIDLLASDRNKAFSYSGRGMLTRFNPKKSAQTDGAKDSIIEITAEESGNYNWRGKSLSAAELESALFSEIKINPISAVRLLKGDTNLSMERNLEFGSIVHAIDAKAFYELNGEFRSITFDD